MSEALDFNRAQGFPRAEVAFIQRIVGCTADGIWGPGTVKSIETWQHGHGIAPADGKVWRSTQGDTWLKLLEAGAATWWHSGSTTITRIGLWTFSDAANPSNSAHASALSVASASGLTDISFTLNDASKQTYALKGTRDAVIAAAKAFKDKGVDVGLNLFVFPGVDYIDALANDVLAIDEGVGLRRLDIDAEELWIRNGSRDDKLAAAKRLGERFAGVDFQIAINGIVFTNHDALDPLVTQDCVTHVTPQAYSVGGKTDKDGSPSRSCNPIDLQATAASKWGGWWPKRTMVGGFATYKQGGVYELGTLSEGLGLALQLRAWTDQGVSEVFGWSAKQVSDAAAAVMKQRPGS